METYRQTYLKDNPSRKSWEPSLSLSPERSQTSFGKHDYGLPYGQLNSPRSFPAPLPKPSAASPPNASVRYLSANLEDNVAAVYNTYKPEIGFAPPKVGFRTFFVSV
eukprot:9360059-Pyramimonas_sp.AAC.1